MFFPTTTPPNYLFPTPMVTPLRKTNRVVLQYVWGQDVDRFLKLGNFASTTLTNILQSPDQLSPFFLSGNIPLCVGNIPISS